MLLAIDSSTHLAGVALIHEGQVLGEINWRVGQNHSRELLPTVLRLLEHYGGDRPAEPDAGRDLLAPLDGLVVATGPGSFNGVRVALSTAKGLAVTRDLPLVGVSTLEAQAYQHAAAERPIWSLLRAGREHVAAASYRMADGEWRTLAEPHLATVDEFCARVEEPVVICGEILPAILAELQVRLGRLAQVVPAAAELRRAGYLAALGEARLARGERADPVALQPLYLRRPSISPRRGER